MQWPSFERISFHGSATAGAIPACRTVKLSSPGTAGNGTNPEQLFAAGWSARFEGAMGLAAKSMKVTLPDDLAIDAEVDLCREDGAYFLQARLNISLPGLDRDTVQALVDAAHQTCPYSKATRGNIDVAINMVSLSMSSITLGTTLRNLPSSAGTISIMRSIISVGYGRVLVERVEGSARKAEWRRAYDEINVFETEQAANGAITPVGRLQSQQGGTVSGVSSCPCRAP